MRSINHTLRAVPLVLALLAPAAACSKDAAADGTADPKRPSTSGKLTSANAGGAASGASNGGAGARGAGAGGRPSPSITLAPTDVATVTPTTIEDGVALT